MENSGQFARNKGLKHNMYVIRHYTPREQSVSLAVKLPQCICNNVGYRVIPKKAGAGAMIEILFNPASVQPDEPLPFRLGEFPAHLLGGPRDILALKQDRPQNFLRQ
jgi:hypothetical protein